MIDIIAHRGFWETKEEQNTEVSFKRALKNRFGIETDLRDRNEEIVISHDMANSSSITLDTFLDLCELAPDVTLAFNIKSDGLQENLLSKSVTNPHFYFDMSVPDMLGFKKLNLPTYTRFSNIEKKPSLYEDSIGVWLDNFNNEILDINALKQFLMDGKKVVLVSPELHRMDKENYWESLSNFIIENPKTKSAIGLCTDFPLKAREYFYV